MNERRAIKVPLGMLKGKPMSTSVPTFEFRFHAAEEQLEEIYPEIEEEVAVPLDTAERSEATPVAPPRSPKASSARWSPGPKLPRSLHSPVDSSPEPSPEPSPLKEALKPGYLSKRSTSMEAGIGESVAAGPAASDTWRILHELKGKITRTVEDKFTEMKNDRIARSENRKSRLAACSGKKDDASFSDSEDASSSENSNQINTVSSSNSVSQLSGVSSLSTTPTGTGTGSSTRKVSKTDDEAGPHSRPTTPCIPDRSGTGTGKATRAGSVPTLKAESPTVEMPPKRSLSLRSQIKPKFCELRNRRRKAESNSSISSAVFSGDGEETDEGDGTDAVEEGVEALEEEWPDTTVTPSVPLGTMLSALNDTRPPPPLPPPPCLTLKQKIWLHRYVVVVISLACLMAMLPVVPVPLFVLFGGVLVILVQEEMKRRSATNPSVASMNMGFAPFSYPNYSEMPVLQVPAAAEVVPAPCFEGWMNDFAGKYETNSYHISLTESVFVRLEGSMLTLKYTRAKIPKRAMWNEPPSRKVTFTHVRHFNIRGCQVKLLPEGIARRRQWSKKYPMCIVLNSGNASGSASGNVISTPDETADLEVDEIRPMPEDEKEESPSSKKVTASAKYAKSSTESLELTILRSDDSIGDLAKESKEIASSKKRKLETNSSKEGNSDLSGGEAEDDESFSIINSDASNCLYLFARADREKEEWYRRFAEAVRPRPHRLQSYETILTGRDAKSVEIDDANPLTPSLAIATLMEYLRYMQRFQLENKPYLIHPPETKAVEKEDKKREKDKEKEKDKDKHKEKDSERERERERGREFEAMVTASDEKGAPMAWLNALVGRLCFDILRSAQWKKRLHQRLQKKLSTLKLPYFVEDLTVTELDLGDTVPLIHRTSQPTLDVRGLWVEMDVTYQGGFRMTIESKLNLMKLKKNVSVDTAAALLTNNAPPESPAAGSAVSSPVSSAGATLTAAAAAAAAANTSRSPVFDSDLDDSAESSSDDDHSIQTDDGSERGPGPNPGRTTGKKFLRMVDRIAASKYFQQATEMKYIKKAMEGVSNTRIMLSVELKGLVGTLALNVPPPPSDRLWYGFHGNPKLWLTARPTLGDRQVNFNQISNWIEQKLCQEFQKVLVLPNMDDLVIPVMSSHLPV